MNDALRPAPRPASTANDDHYRRQGLRLLIAFAAMVRIGRSYDMTNQVVHRHVETLLETLNPLLEEWGEAVLVPFDSDLYLNGMRVPIENMNDRHHRVVVDAFRRRGISGLSIGRGIARGDLEKFFDLFLHREELAGLGFVEACRDAHVGHIHPATHASTTPLGDSDFEVGTESPATEGASHAGSGMAAGGQGTGVGGGSGAGSGPGTAQASSRLRISQAVQGARSLLMTTSLHGGLEMRHAKRVVQPLVDGAFADEPIVVGLAGLAHHHEHTYAHAVAVCAIAVSMGHHLGLDRRTLADLGVAALLHDVGKGEVADRIRQPASRFTREEREQAERHPVEGARLIARATGLNPTTLRTLRVALEHHAAESAGGYPPLPAGWRPSVLSQLVALADCYVSFQTLREEGSSISPHESLGKLLGPLAGRFHPALLWALIQSVGIFPPGQMVELDDGSIARVLAPNPADPARPHVRIVTDAAGLRLGVDEARDLCPIPAERAVKRALPLGEYPNDEVGEVRQAA